MMGGCTVVAIHVSPGKGKPMASVDTVQAVAGRGLEEDRYYVRAGTFSGKVKPGRQVTLVESESVEALERDHGIPLDQGATRRNVTTRGVALNHLVNRTFRVGEATLRGVDLCEPCGYLEGLTRPGVRKGLIHRGGLNAEIVGGGTITVGDAIHVD
jgi:MOSC domain-containing protein YiiM